ncbi:MAG: hypothetical protein GY950_28290 [bacterium]|nr:hypothetical protein [bacterium]
MKPGQREKNGTGAKALLADALHQAGQFAEAEKWFREAEDMQKKRQPEFIYLYSLRGFQFCDLLLSQGKYPEVMERAEKALEIANRNRHLISIALDHLTLGRAWMSQSISENTGDFRRAMAYLDRAVTGLREAGRQDILPLGLLSRADCYRRQRQFDRAWQDLTEATEIAESGDMKLHQTDALLLAAALCEDEGKNSDAKEHRRKAEELIEETGYKRREKINY